MATASMLGSSSKARQSGPGMEPGVAPGDRGQFLRAEITNRPEFRSADLGEVPHQIGTPVAVSDNADSEHGQLGVAVEAITMPQRMMPRPMILWVEIGSRKTSTAPDVTRTNVSPTSTG